MLPMVREEFQRYSVVSEISEYIAVTRLIRLAPATQYFASQLVQRSEKIGTPQEVSSEPLDCLGSRCDNKLGPRSRFMGIDIFPLTRPTNVDVKLFPFAVDNARLHAVRSQESAGVGVFAARAIRRRSRHADSCVSPSAVIR